MKPANREYTAGLGKLLVKQKQFPSGDRRVNRPGSQVSLLESRLQISLLDTPGGGGYSLHSDDRDGRRIF